MAWTEEQIQDISQRVAEGESYLTVARYYGVNRNAIAGVVHRLRKKGVPLEKRAIGRPRRANGKSFPPIRGVSTSAPLPIIEEPAFIERGASFLEDFVARKQWKECCWVEGDLLQGDAKVCREPVWKDRPRPAIQYCKEHYKMAYQPARRK